MSLVCPYCNKKFEDEHERGVHMSEEHVDTESNITKHKRQHDPRTNIIEDQWNKEDENNEEVKT